MVRGRLGVRPHRVDLEGHPYIHGQVLLVGSPTSSIADNDEYVLTWDRALLVKVMVAGLEIDFDKVLITVIPKRAFKNSFTYALACLLFQLCRR